MASTAWSGKLRTTIHPQTRVARQLQKHMPAYLDRARQGYDVLGTVGTRTTDPYGATILMDGPSIVIELTHGAPGAIIRITRDRVECTHAEAREHFAVIRDIMTVLNTHPSALAR